MSIASEIAKMAVDDSRSSKHTATVLRTDNDGTTWVSIPGGADETFLHGSTVECSPGDQVEVVIENGRAYATGNMSAPSVGERVVVKYVTPIEEVANQAAIAAGHAQESAEMAEKAADAATASAAVADEKANEAKDSAGRALESATEANGYAKNALEGLSVVEDVVDVVEWLAAHATPTTDREIDAEKAYYERSDQGTMTRIGNDVIEDSYSTTDDGQVDASKTYYIHSEDHYELTQDTEPNPQKTYYTESSGEYSEVTDYTYDYVLTEDSSVVESKYYYTRLELYSYALTQDTWPVSGKTYYALADGSYTPISDYSYEYALTEDSAIDQSKTYYTMVEETAYSLTSDEIVDPAKTYYVEDGVEETYSPTTDVQVVEGKTYYVSDGDDGYLIVEEPSDEDIASYYEMTVTTVYAEVEEPSDADLPSYYELVTSVSYDEVEQPDVADIATYYELTLDMSGYYERTVTGYDYQDVEEPNAADIATYYERVVDMSAYYEHVPESYAQAEPQGSENPSALGWCEQGNPMLQGLYELDDSVNNYIATHLGLTDAGLNLVSDESGYRILVAVDGVYIYDELSNVVGKYGTDMQIGALSGTHMVASGDTLMFLPKGAGSVVYEKADVVEGDSVEGLYEYDGETGAYYPTADATAQQGKDYYDPPAPNLDGAVAYIAIDPDTNESVFYMTKSVVMKDMFFGDGLWKWYKRANNNMSLKWMGAM